jgi:predicted amidohydrolase YtcJ
MRLDLILYNARVRTMDPRRPAAQRVGVLNGRIAGLDEQIDGCDAPVQIDLDGATVLPGFNDAHAHSVWYGLSLNEVDLAAALSVDDVYARIAAAAASAPPDAWIVGGGYDHTRLGGQFPDRDALDAASGQRPVWIKHRSGHVCVVNGVALDRIAATGASFEVAGGTVVLGADGRPTGVLEENAMRLVQDLTLPHPSWVIEDALERATRQYAREGLTSVTDAGIAGGWIGNSPSEFGAYQNAHDAGRLSTRMQPMIAIDALDAPVFGLGAGVRSGVGDEWLQIGPAKIFTDGSLLAATAYMSADYPGCDHRGYLQDDPDALRERALRAANAGWSLALHAIGDGAMDFALDVLAAVDALEVRSPLPHRIEHAGVVRPDQLGRLWHSGAVAVPQPLFIAEFGEGMRARLGERTPWAYRAASLLAGGMVLPGSSDRPVAGGAPLAVIQAFVERLTESGEPFGPDERLTVEQALAAYTVGSAAATGWSGQKGVVAPGMLADLVVLGDDPLFVDPSRLDAIAVLATVLGGRFTHGSPGLFASSG